jgi:iron complex outermembrane recepter protein
VRNLWIVSLSALILMGVLLIVTPQFCLAEEPTEEEAETKAHEKTEKDVYELEDVIVTSPDEGVVYTPSSTTINVEKYEQAGTAQNIVDILRDSALIDFRGASDLVQDNDNVYMRGFDSRNFVMSWDGLSMGKTEGQGGKFVDFTSIPLSQIESIELLPGPHSALHSGRAIGGVVNVKTRTPKRYETLKPDFRVLTSYRSYNTQTHRVNMDGGAGAFVYGFSYENYHTDGYLRHNKYDSESINGSIGYILPDDGYINFTMAYRGAERESAEANDPESGDYDPTFPAYENGSDPGEAATRKNNSYFYRLNFQQPTDIGKWTIAASYTHENRDSYYDDGTQCTGRPGPKKWNDYATNIQDEFRIFTDHLITVGFDHQQQRANEWQEENASYAGFIQDKWSIVPRLTLTGGLRYEYWDIWWSNRRETALSYDPSAGDYIKKDYNELIPKMFLTYGLDDLSAMLRDTSVSLGVSKIWSPTSYCPHCSWGSGIELDPVHGVGYDLVLMRRLWNDINLKIDFSYYEMKDYVVSASDQDYIDAGGWERRRMNLEEVIQEGVEVELNGHLFDPLSFYVSYSYTDWRYHGPNTGIYVRVAERLDDRAKNRVSAGLKYRPFENTMVMLDYKYQDDQVALACEEEPEGSENWVCTENPMDAYEVFDFAIEQTLLKDRYHIRDAKLKFYINNLFDEEYENSRGYPMTDRTYGASLSLDF